ncbi:MAG TPA: helix-turn-helix domain-containing protein [Candidatus Aveggerthella excrementigallinarum]|nr:helix-turn-helix domain-containing protein [Candidatus Aveggerthella excrementigallinarum]
MAAHHMSFGTILRESREQKRLDLTVVARRLRIRPDILEAIEDADFTRMPPRGYTRNMVNAYAHFLGLNATEITRMYLDECYAYQTGAARPSGRGHGFDMGGGRHGIQGELRRDASGRRRFSDGYRTEETSRLQHTGRMAGSRLQRPSSSRSAVQDIQYSNFYSGTSQRNQVKPASKLPFIIAGAIILVLVVIVCVLLFGPKQATTNATQDVMPVTGISESGSAAESSSSAATSESSSSAEQAQQNELTEPTKTVVEYSVPDGASVYLEVYVDGAAVVADDITGPERESFDVTGTIEFNVVADEGEVTITQDGQEVALTDDDGNGVMSLTIDFADVLAKWKADHPDAASAASAAGADSGSSSASASSSSSSSSATADDTEE